MKYYLCLTIIISYFTCIFTPVFAQYKSQEQYFIVTAYYSPLPDQNYYITGNYEDEKILNGQGIAGASGKKVYSGMLAAPKKYPFGTKIYLEGLGIGSVEDRGGAIVPAGQRGYSHDRIDIWVGHGEEGLKRAMYWGKRKVAGKILSQGSETLDYTALPAPDWVLKNIPPVQQASNNSHTQNTLDIFSMNLGRGSDREAVSKLQDILHELGFLEAEYENGIYDSATINAIFDLQIQTQILESASEAGAGFFGPKTRKELKIIYESHLEEQEKKQAFFETYEALKQQSSQEAREFITALGIPKYGDISPQVRTLQKTLRDLGYFSHKDTAIFGVKTQNALIQYQIDMEIIGHEQEIGAGLFGPQTRAHMQKTLTDIYLQKYIALQGLSEAYENYVVQKIDEEDASPQAQIRSIFST